MNKLVSCLLIFFSPFFLSAQTDYETSIARQKGNKVVLLGEWKPIDRAKWKQVLGSDEIADHDFGVIESARLSPVWANSSQNPKTYTDAFERWFRQKYGIGGAR
ncbi:MAG: hypothetical protein LBH03_05775 [Holophagales bacterium]|jgi:hypothetical protein|nr:hypothetical protein [Holophagales bacterium]